VPHILGRLYIHIDIYTCVYYCKKGEVFHLQNAWSFLTYSFCYRLMVALMSRH
jgi:hypothetical protein